MSTETDPNLTMSMTLGGRTHEIALEHPIVIPSDEDRSEVVRIIGEVGRVAYEAGRIDGASIGAAAGYPLGKADGFREGKVVPRPGREIRTVVRDDAGRVSHVVAEGGTAR